MGKKVSEMVVHVRPLKEFVAQAKELGFGMLFHHDEARWQVAIRLEPLDPRTAETLRRHTDDADCDGIEVTTVYDRRRRKAAESGVSIPYADEGERAHNIEVSAQDTALAALRMAREALGLQAA